MRSELRFRPIAASIIHLLILAIIPETSEAWHNRHKKENMVSTVDKHHRTQIASATVLLQQSLQQSKFFSWKDSTFWPMC